MGIINRVSDLEMARFLEDKALKETNQTIEELGEHDYELYCVLNELQNLFDKIRNVSSEDFLKYQEYKKIKSDWKNGAETIEKDYNAAIAKDAGAAAAGAAAGVAVAAMGPTVAMGVATTFGVASTGTAISTLYGAAATNSALAWLGGGALAAGGGGVAAGEALVALAGPVGWAIAGVSLCVGGLLFIRRIINKNRLESIFVKICRRNEKKYNLANIELKERIKLIDFNTNLIKKAIAKTQLLGEDYQQMAEKDQYLLGKYVALMGIATDCLTRPILGLKTIIDKDDYYEAIASSYNHLRETSPDLEELFTDLEESLKGFYKRREDITIYLANLLYKIKLDEKDKKLIQKFIEKNQELLEQLNINKDVIDDQTMVRVDKLLDYKYRLEDEKQPNHRVIVKVKK